MDVAYSGVEAGGKPAGRLLHATAEPVPHAKADPTGRPRARVQRLIAVSRLVSFLALVVLAGAMICSGLGHEFARRSDQQHVEQQRVTVRNAVSEFRDLLVVGGKADPRFVRTIEHAANVNDLRFETELADSTREVVPVISAQGRISGFLTWQAEAPMTAAIGRLLPMLALAALLLGGFAAVSIWQLRRARHQLRASEAEARRIEEIDPLTGLPNELKLRELLAAVVAERDGREVVTYCMIELAGLDEIHDQLGSHGRNDIVATSAARLTQALPSGVVCGRAGDGFGIILSGDIDIAGHMRTAIEAIERPQWLETVLRVSACAGFAQVPRDATGHDELIRRAELALNAATVKGPGTIVAFDLSIDARSSEQQFIRRELPRALAAGALELHYQPIVMSDGNRIVGVEALARWKHRDRGDIPPSRFIPVAEQMGLMKELGAFVLRRALEEGAKWPDCYIAVNLSPLQARDASIVDYVRDALEAAAVPSQRLILEITEGVLIDNPDEMVRRIEELRALGVRIALDDFGSGYSNLGYLQRFPFDKLKIDRSFVSPLGRSSNGGVIVQAIVALGRALGVSVLAEGVETEEQRVLLRLAGCDEMQGFLFAKPVPASAIDRLMAQRQRAVEKAS